MSARIKRYGKIFALVVLVLAGFVLVGLIVTRVPAEDNQDGGGLALIEQDLDSVKSLLEAGDLGAANELIDQVIVDTVSPDYADMLAKLAEKYEKYDIDRAQHLAQIVVDSCNDTAAAEKMRYMLDRNAIESLIDTGDIESAMTAIETFQSSYTDQASLPSRIYRFAQRCCLQGDSEAGVELYTTVAEDYPDSRESQDARLRTAQCSIYALQAAGAADEQVDQAIAGLEQDCSSHSDLVEVLSEIAEKYLYYGQPEKAAEMLADYQQRYPDDEHRDYILMNQATASVYTGDKALIKSVFDQLISDYSERQDKIANALFGVANHYRLMGEYENERQLYRHVCKQWRQETETFWQQWAVIYSRIISGQNNGYDQQVEALIAQCPDDDKASRFFYWLGNAFHRMGDVEQACNMYQVAIERWPLDSWTLSSRLATILLDPALDDSARQIAIENFVNDYYGHKHYAVAAYRTACDVYHNAEQKRREGQSRQAKIDAERVLQAIAIIDGDAYDRGSLTVKQELNIVKVHCLYQVGQIREMISACETFLSEWPQYGNRYILEMRMAEGFRCLINSGQLTVEEETAACAKVTAAYLAVREGAYSESVRAQAALELGQFYLKRQQWKEAAEPLESFLASGENWGRSRRNAIFRLRQVYKHLDRLELADDVDREYSSVPADGDVLGGQTRLAILLGG